MESYLEHIEAKIAYRIGLFRYLSRSAQEPNNKTMMNVFKSVIRTVIIYGYPVLLTADQKIWDRLQIMQNKAIRAALDLPILEASINSIILVSPDNVTLVNEQKGPISRPTPPISPFNRLSVSSTSLPLVSIPPRLIPLATTTTCLILPIVLPPSSPAAASPTITSPSSPTAMETVTSNKMQFICSITKENEPAWLIGLKQFHHDALRPVDKQIQRLSDDHRIVEDHLNEAEEMITSTAEQKKQLDEECRPGQWFLNLVLVKGQNDKRIYTNQSALIKENIDQMRAARAKINQYWLDRINDELRKRQTHNYRHGVLSSKTTIKRLNQDGGRRKSFVL
ncbi:unnamed protein product [Adineta ricciae]|uniref:Uncharacterized protein n=1 Tax=Adineta ricciae TaxID=249248 RepID=A0A816C5E5_ADIRI|nr:unnamed protein product [Adineta ricciae]